MKPPADQVARDTIRGEVEVVPPVLEDGEARPERGRDLDGDA